MSDFFASGRAVDVVLAVVAVELIALLLLRRDRFAGLALAILPGVCLLLAVRAALTGAGWGWVALFLAASFPLHLLDVGRRLRR